jgi:hypothetical protein
VWLGINFVGSGNGREGRSGAMGFTRSVSTVMVVCSVLRRELPQTGLQRDSDRLNRRQGQPQPAFG